MKLAIISRNYLPRQLGGNEVATDAIARRLAERVHVITSQNKGWLKTDKQGRLCLHRVFRANFRFIWFIVFPIQALFAVKRIDPQLVHAAGLHAGVAGLLCKKLLKKPFSVWGQGSDVYRSGPVLKSIYALVLANADIVLALTTHMKTSMQNTCNCVVDVIPNGVDLKPFKDINREEARTRLHIRKDERIIIFVGSLLPIKGVNYLIEAMNPIHKRATNTKLFIVGDGPEKKQLESLAQRLGANEFVWFLGRVEREEVPPYLMASDVFVLPSLSEGFPLVVLEAMAAGLPLVTTDLEQLSEIIKQDVNGFLVEPRNSAQIAEKVLLVLNDAQRRARISKANQDAARACSWSSVADQLEDRYRTFLEQTERTNCICKR
jgi:glycosyltransferase involved in cell wall biosynthesis